MSADMELIEQLENEIGMKFYYIEFEAIEDSKNNCYAIGEGRVTALNLNRITLDKLPASLPGFSHLKKLCLNDTGLKDISFIKNMTNLTHLDLRTSGIDNLSFLRELHRLTNLDLSNNQVKDVSFLQDLGNLTQLNLSGNQVADISSLQRLSKLTRLNLNSNQIIDISPLQELYNLTALDVMDNKINELSEGIIELGLPIDVDPPFSAIGGEKIFLHGNPMEKPPLDIIRKGTIAMKDYFKSLKRGGTQPLNEVKVLLVGEGGAGKTSLVKRLLGKDFDKNEPETHGINIDNWQVEQGGNEIKVHLWDFGGQEIMHATHQFFLSERSLYILVLDSRKEEKAEYWLQHIGSFGGDSPILVVLNKIDQNPAFDVNQKFLKEKYRNIKDFYRISCATGKGIRKFTSVLAGELAAIKHIRSDWAQSWFNVKKHLENMEKPYISYEEYQNLCLQEHIDGGQERRTLLGFLNDLGVVLHFEDANLMDLHVLEPKWITNAVYKIITSDILSEQKGVLQLSFMDNILKPANEGDYVYPGDKYAYIIALMQKFELCFKIDDQRVLIPDLLDVGEPEIDFEYILKFQLHYDFLPKSIMTRLIVRRHNEIKRLLRWRSGVVLEKKDSDGTAIIKMDGGDKKISIYVTEPLDEDYLLEIIKIIRRINRTFKNMKVDERVPLPDNPTITVSYSHLIRLEERGWTEFLPEGAEREYQVQELLKGIKPSDAPGAGTGQPLKEGRQIINISQVQNNRQKTTTTQIQQIQMHLSEHLPVLQGEFDKLKELLINAKADPGLKTKLTELGDGLDALSAESEKEKLNRPLNKLHRFLKELGNENSDSHKILNGAKKGIKTLQDVGRTYNKVAQWLALPQVPDAFLGKK